MDQYDCSQGLVAEITSFESLQSAISCCKGVNQSLPAYEVFCKTCDSYITNRHAKDVAEDAAFLDSQRALSS